MARELRVELAFDEGRGTSGASAKVNVCVVGDGGRAGARQRTDYELSWGGGLDDWCVELPQQGE